MWEHFATLSVKYTLLLAPANISAIHVILSQLTDGVSGQDPYINDGTTAAVMKALCSTA